MRSLKVLLIVVLLVFGVSVGAAAAAPVAATSSLPYIWVRSAPSSYASAIYTVYPTAYATLQTTGNTQWDGYQTWAEVTVIANGSVRGWVEQGSLVSAAQTAAPAQNGQVNRAVWPQSAAAAQGQALPNRTTNAPAAPQQGMPNNPWRQ